MSAAPIETEVRVDADGPTLPGTLGQPRTPDRTAGLVIFVHGSGSSRLSPRNVAVARWLVSIGCATLLFDLLTPSEAEDRRNVFDIELLSRRVAAATHWASAQPGIQGLPIGYFGASTGAAAALVASTLLAPQHSAAATAGAASSTEPRGSSNSAAPIAAIVSRGGRPDLAGDALPHVTAPTLLIVGSRDTEVLELNRQARARLRSESRLAVVNGATHLFEEPGALEQAADHAAQWFTTHFAAAASHR